ncbi:MAG: response regulator [Candidatus Koribacter versatilis]|uniref:Response regulator n=1 Tax=Candidatus Korobacter versatilis TaxID=658062 RepID=A0A932EPC0_9BACT|nr:response regulator [Candidatus Koribacter versatilis]
MSDLAQGATPTIYFIDDSATMREVIKIAFRRENINVVACNDAASALAMIEQERPSIVITDVIMPDKDGYEVCQYIKQHPVLGKTPVILMSGVVNRAVAEKAFAVKADELIRKPFQPQDLITRVKHLLYPGAPVQAVPPPEAASAALSSIFASASHPAPRPASAMRPAPAQPAYVPPAPRPVAAPMAAPAAAAAAPAPAHVAPPMPVRPTATATMDAAKLKNEIMRLESLVKKLQSELTAEREYSRALEAHVKTLQASE